MDQMNDSLTKEENLEKFNNYYETRFFHVYIILEIMLKVIWWPYKLQKSQTIPTLSYYYYEDRDYVSKEVNFEWLLKDLEETFEKKLRDLVLFKQFLSPQHYDGVVALVTHQLSTWYNWILLNMKEKEIDLKAENRLKKIIKIWLSYINLKTLTISEIELIKQFISADDLKTLKLQIDKSVNSSNQESNFDWKTQVDLLLNNPSEYDIDDLYIDDVMGFSEFDSFMLNSIYYELILCLYDHGWNVDHISIMKEHNSEEIKEKIENLLRLGITLLNCVKYLENYPIEIQKTWFKGHSGLSHLMLDEKKLWRKKIEADLKSEIAVLYPKLKYREAVRLLVNHDNSSDNLSWFTRIKIITCKYVRHRIEKDYLRPLYSPLFDLVKPNLKP